MIQETDAALYILSLDPNQELFNKKLRVQNERTFYEGNARLNKYIHLAQNIYIAKYGEPLVDSRFYAYDNGVVDPDIQEIYSVLLAQRNKKVEINASDRAFLNTIFKVFKNATLDELIELSHEDPEWEKKHQYFSKEDQIMDSMAHKEEYKKRYADMVKVMERMSI